MTKAKQIGLAYRPVNEAPADAMFVAQPAPADGVGRLVPGADGWTLCLVASSDPAAPVVVMARTLLQREFGFARMPQEPARGPGAGFAIRPDAFRLRRQAGAAPSESARLADDVAKNIF